MNPMTRLLLISAAALAIASPALAQNAPKPISRSDFLKNVDARFNNVDTNHDGKVTREELAAAQQRDLQNAKAALNKRMEDEFKRLDTNHDGVLSLQEFLAAAPAIKTTETPDQLLARLDTNHDGKVSLEEFRAPEIAKFNRIDANHDGVITPAELQAATGKK
jgi:Ca2+-binding EF-hand superfamily protein